MKVKLILFILLFCSCTKYKVTVKATFCDSRKPRLATFIFEGKPNKYPTCHNGKYGIGQCHYGTLINVCEIEILKVEELK